MVSMQTAVDGDCMTGGHLRALAADGARELHVLGLDRDPLAVDGLQVAVLKEADQVCLSRLLQRDNRLRLPARPLGEARAGGDFVGDLADEALEGQLVHSSFVLFWYLRISLSATVPGRKRFTGFDPAMEPALLRAALEANCLRGAFPPVLLFATCFVRAIVKVGLNARFEDRVDSSP